jgi:hypothetical protein
MCRRTYPVSVFFATLLACLSVFAQEEKPPEDPMEQLVEMKKAELEAKAELKAERRAGDDDGKGKEEAPSGSEAHEEAKDEAAQAQTTKGAGDTSEAPEPDYLALADAPLFLPRNYLYWGSPVGPKEKRESLVFGLEYALHLPIWSNLRDTVLIGNRWAGAVTLSFEGAVRMVSRESKPVRMPSYRPNISGQLFYIFHQRLPIIVGVRGNIFHYSNGQEQCTFGGDEVSESDVCQQRIRTERSPRTDLNRSYGDFSMNGWLGEVHARLHEVNEKGVAIGHLDLGFGMSGHIMRGPGSMDAPLRQLYGKYRTELVLEWRRRMGWAAITARGAYVAHPNSGYNIPVHNGRAELVLDPYWLTGLGVFARYDAGRDFYNAFFVDRLQQFAVGISWDGERPLKFERK